MKDKHSSAWLKIFYKFLGGIKEIIHQIIVLKQEEFLFQSYFCADQKDDADIQI